MIFQARKHKKLFLLSAMAPLLSVILSTLIVFLTRADKHGVKIVKHITGGLNPTSIHDLQFNSPHTAEAAKIGLIVALIALTVRQYILYLVRQSMDVIFRLKDLTYI